MGKGSSRRPQLISEEEAQSNWDKIFRKKEFECNTACGHYECMDHQDQCKRLNKMILNKVNSPDVSPHAYEYELNKSTGEVEKRFLDGISKPNESQFNGN